MSSTAVIVDGARTPFVRAGTSLKEVSAAELGRAVGREVLDRSAIEPHELDEVIFGCVAQPADASNIARVIALRAGVGEEVPAFTVSRNCASGMEAVTLAAEKIQAGRAQAILAGGTESMSRIALQYPLAFGWKVAALSRARGLREKVVAAAALRLRDFRPTITLVQGLTDPVVGEIMGRTAERLAREFGSSREEQDRFALESHRRATSSRSQHTAEIHPLAVAPRFHELHVADVGPREEQSMEALGRMKPYFDRRLGTVTIGNTCGVTDGAAALLVAEEEWARSRGLPVLGRLRAHAYRGCEPRRMGLGPVHASSAALQAAGLQMRDMTRVELNEAFAAQVIACLRAFDSDAYGCELGNASRVGEIDPARLNVHGGAIAIGHPVGATGARLILTLCHQLREAGGGFGLATLCIGGGQGGAVVVEGVAA